MLVVKDDIFIVNLEGEPQRALADRRRKVPAARDVAGMLRSIDYSVAAALDRALRVSADDQGKLAAALEQWRDQSIATFMAAYTKRSAETRLWPADPQASRMHAAVLPARARGLRDRPRAQQPARLGAGLPMMAVLRLIEGY